jgi:dephospho-CoA kinase
MSPGEDTKDSGLVLDAGLTGGIASGKSTVDGMLEMLGAHIIDADALAHDLLHPGRPERDRVAERFGPGVVGPDGAVDRKALGAIVFADAGARADLNAILHPAVRREEARLRESFRQAGGGIVITDAALLVETGHHVDYDRLVVVACDPSLQVARLLARDPGLHATQAEARLAAQAPVEEKLAVADYVIETSGSLGDTKEQAHRVYRHLVEDLEARRHGEPLPSRTRPEVEGR